MRTGNSLKGLLQPILSSTYTPLDIRALVQECFFLALPLIRKRIALGKLNLDIIGLKESDIVYDCLAELFNRNQEGEFKNLKLISIVK